MSAPAATRIRQSFAARYDQCPLSAKMEADATRVDTHAQARGTVFHEFARRLIVNCMETGERAAPPGFARDLMGEVLIDSGLPIPAREHDTLVELAGEFAQTREFAIDRIVDLEETYTIEVDGVTITGRPDRLDVLDREAWVWDYKSGWATDPDAEIRGTFQGRLYGRMAFDAYPQVQTVHLCWDYPRWGANGIRQTTLTRDDLPNIDNYLKALVARIVRSFTEDEWQPSPGPWCHTCPAPDRCPIPLAERREGAILDREMAEAYAHQVTVLDALIKQRRKALRPWCDEHGPIVLDGVEFGFRMKSDSEQCRDKPALREAMETAGIDWVEHFKTVKGSAEFRARKATVEGEK